MRTIILTLFLLFTVPVKAEGENLAIFLKSCGYGTAFGAGAGLVSLAFNDQPSKNLNVVARGASLGLYAGIAVGIYRVNSGEASSSGAWVLPSPDGGMMFGYNAEF